MLLLFLAVLPLHADPRASIEAVTKDETQENSKQIHETAKASKPARSSYTVITEVNLVSINQFLGLPELKKLPATFAGIEEHDIKLLSLRDENE